MIEEIKRFIKEAGAYSLEKRHREEHQYNYKQDGEAARSLVTEVDLEISRRFKQFVEQQFFDLNCIIIDEESVSAYEENVFDLVEGSDYQFVIDPIDGTINYAADIPLYGISIGVLKKGKPWRGFLYAPALGELVYTDGEKVYFEKGEEVRQLAEKEFSSSKVVLAHQWDIDIFDNHFAGRLIVEDYFSAVVNLMFFALGRVKGVFARAYIWDLSAAMAICRVLGAGFFDYETGGEMTAFSREFFENSCKSKKLHIVCFPEELERVKSVSRCQRKG